MSRNLLFFRKVDNIAGVLSETDFKVKGLYVDFRMIIFITETAYILN